ncbi:unnamed protein product [Mytilus edulis]|uniref:Major facilitator superfamily (MFS) profile domain-containing protein n=1 Tax=Mytilus edulis TaxID=6550 RepID=A0A8S3SAM2_MYTED|nr:unnamed protein product [Mytilus edulis]
MAKEFDWDKTQSGSILGCFFWGYTMTQFLGGYLSDKVGGDVVVPIAACFWSILTFWTPQFAYLSTDKYVTLHILVLSRVLLGMFQGFYMPSVTSLIGHFIEGPHKSFYTPIIAAGQYFGFPLSQCKFHHIKKSFEHERLTYSFICSGSHLGTLISGSIGSILLERYGWQSVFYFVGVCSILWMLGMRYILIAKHRKKYLPFIMAENLADKPIKKDQEKVPWLTLFVKPAFWGLLVGHFSHANSFFILLSWAPTYFHENYPNAKGWVFNVVPWIVSMFSSVFSGWLADHLLEKGYSVTFVRKFIETISLGGTALGLILLSYMTTFGGALFCMAIAVACCGFHNSGILVNPQDIAPKHAGSVFGIMNMAGAIPGFVGVYMAGHILEATKSWAAVFNQTAGVCIFGCIVYLLFGTGKRII